MDITFLFILKIATINSVVGTIFGLINYFISYIYEYYSGNKKIEPYIFPFFLLLWPMTASDMNEGEGICPPAHLLRPWQYFLVMSLIGPLPKIIFNIFPLTYIFLPYLLDFIGRVIGGIFFLLVNAYKLLSGERTYSWKEF